MLLSLAQNPISHPEKFYLDPGPAFPFPALHTAEHGGQQFGRPHGEADRPGAKGVAFTPGSIRQGGPAAP